MSPSSFMPPKYIHFATGHSCSLKTPSYGRCVCVFFSAQLCVHFWQSYIQHMTHSTYTTSRNWSIPHLSHPFTVGGDERCPWVDKRWMGSTKQKVQENNLVRKGLTFCKYFCLFGFSWLIGRMYHWIFLFYILY